MSRLLASSIIGSRPTSRIITDTTSTYILVPFIRQQRLYAGGGEGELQASTNSQECSQNTEQNSSSSSKGGNDAQPKILNESIPTEETEDVKKHNEDMAKRHDRADTHADDGSIKVDKTYWNGTGGVSHKK